MKNNNTFDSKLKKLLCVNIVVFAVIGGSYLINSKESDTLSSGSNIINTSAIKDKLYKNLESMQTKYPEVSVLLENYDQYPKEVLELVVKYPEALDFAIQYPNRGKLSKKNQSFDLSKVPKLYQWDTRWGYNTYGEAMLAFTGCGPTVLSMAAMYITQDQRYTPDYIAKFSEDNGYYVDGAGTSWDLFNYGVEQLGLTNEVIGNDQSQIDQILNNGGVIVCSVLPGDFTSTGHFILITGIDSNSYYFVHDPNSVSRSNTTYSYEQLSGQLHALWAFTK